MNTVSERALLARINRKLRPDLEMVRKCRKNTRGFHDLGYFYRLDVGRNFIMDTWLNLEAFARDLGVMHRTEIFKDAN